MIFSGGLEGIKGFSELKENNTHVFSNLQGPSAQVSVNPKLTVAFTWNVRFLWTSKASDADVGNLFTPDSGSLNINRVGSSINSKLNSWNEFGIGAGGVVWEKPHHSITAGGFFKIIFGSGNFDINIDNLEVKAQGDTIQHMGFDMNVLVSQQAYDLVDNGNLDLFGKGGVGFDMGGEYRYTKSETDVASSKYLFKVGFALNDLGMMRYKSGLKYSQLNVSADNIYVGRLQNLSSFEQLIDTLSEIFDVGQSPVTSYTVPLPLSFRLYGDYNFGKNLSLFSEFHFTFFNMVSKSTHIPTYFEYNLTPRYEDKRYGVYLPITFSNFVPASAGLSLRWKPFILGSSNIFTYWAYKDGGKFIDMYLKVKIPVLCKNERARYQKKNSKTIALVGDS